jgi:hypothetical protein
MSVSSQSEDTLRLEDLAYDDYDFIDVGAGIGNSILYCQKRFHAKRGLGLDINNGKVREAQSRGLDVVNARIDDVPESTRVRFVSMLDVLEHLRSLEHVFSTLSAAARIADDFLFIRHPSFEDEAYLRSLGLKQTWTDWTGHRAHILLAEFGEMFDELGLSAWHVRFKDPAYSSTHRLILPLGAPANQTEYAEETCGTKREISFAKPVFRQFDILVFKSQAAFADAPKLVQAIA